MPLSELEAEILRSFLGADAEQLRQLLQRLDEQAEALGEAESSEGPGPSPTLAGRVELMRDWGRQFLGEVGDRVERCRRRQELQGMYDVPILQQVRKQGMARPRELAERMGLDSGNLSRILGRLASAGYLKKVGVRRSRGYLLTPLAEAVLTSLESRVGGLGATSPAAAGDPAPAPPRPTPRLSMDED